MYKRVIGVLLLCFGCYSNNNKTINMSSIDIETTETRLTIFGENTISTPLYERDLAIHPQGNEIIYTLGDYKQQRRCLVVLNKENECWSKPKILPISGTYHDIEPFYANEGNRLYFASNRPIFNNSNRTDYNIWFSDRIEGHWSNPQPLDSLINTRGDEFYPSLSKNGNLYFTATRPNGIGKEDIFFSKNIDGTFLAPEPLPTEINTSLYEFNAYISPDENLLIFSSFGRNDDLGGGDLYISRKDDAGKWSTSKHLGAKINSNKLDYCPFIDWSNRNFYFSSERGTINNQTLSSVDSLLNYANSTLNGCGNIYKIGINQLE